MSDETAIGWTDHTFNPWWGCARVSPGCARCYAETFARRVGLDVWGERADRKPQAEGYWRKPEKWNLTAERAGRPALVFCASMADVFEDRRDLDDDRARVFELIERTPWLRWQVLTKRPEKVLELVPTRWHSRGFPANYWQGTTVEDHERAVERIPHLLAIPARVRFLSVEPLLGPVDLRPWLLRRAGGMVQIDAAHVVPEKYLTAGERLDIAMRPALSWVIVGGESGPRHRPLDVEHARAVRDAVVGADVPFFFKQHGGHHPTSGGDELDGRRWKQFPPEAGDRDEGDGAPVVVRSSTSGTIGARP